MGRCGQAALCPCRPRCTTLPMPNGHPPSHHAHPSISAPTHADCHTPSRRIARTAPPMHPHAQRTPGVEARAAFLVQVHSSSRVAARPRQPAHALTASAAICAGAMGKAGVGRRRCAHAAHAAMRPPSHTPTPPPHSTARRLAHTPCSTAAHSHRPWPSRNTARPHCATTPNCAALPPAPHCTPPTAHCTAHATHRARPAPYCGHTARRRPCGRQGGPFPPKEAHTGHQQLSIRCAPPGQFTGVW